MKAWVYVLQGFSGRHYIGSTVDLERRLEEHRRGHTHTTKRLGTTIEIVASRAFDSLDAARRVERELKAKKNPRLAIFHLQQLQQP